MKLDASSQGPPGNDLCLECGLCCNGVIFGDVKLRRSEVELRARLGLADGGASVGGGRAARLNQPCAAFDGCRCQVYADRPRYCREFECLVLQGVKAGRLRLAAARKIIRTARERAEQVRGLLCTLGDGEESTALAARFRRTAARLEQQRLDQTTAGRFGDLTLAMQDLNVLLSEAFYPGAGGA